MRDPAAEVKRAILGYKAALVRAALVEEGIASQLAMMADEMDRQGQPKVADMLQQAGHHHRAASIRSRAIAASLKVAD
jgi:hypothetical protein